MRRYWGNYRRGYRRHHFEKKDNNDGKLLNHASSLKQEIEANSYDCMVCYDTINAYCSTYSCFQCFNIFHLVCIRKWAVSKLNSDLEQRDAESNWTCPACQIPSETLPKRYLCYCGMVINPAFDPYVLAHSCGQKCGRSKTCNHPCRELCHPGKCPPCVSTVDKSCNCRSSFKKVNCKDLGNEFQCSKVCGKLLNCRRHTCVDVCHAGNCDECMERFSLPCYCSQSMKEVPCGNEKQSENNGTIGFWACGKKCGRILSCGNHFCEMKCHSGVCEPCTTDALHVRTCPCGKTKLEKLLTEPRTSCLDAIPTCKKVCRKELPCGNDHQKHYCNSLCHIGPCPPCEQKTLIMCNCKSISESMPCSEIPPDGLQCEKVCFKKKSCGRHRCNNKCCVEDNHICMYTCNKLLTCKIHKCEDLCHKGHCMPCLMSNFDEVFCTCGKTRLDPPIACGTPPPKCNEVCDREHGCEHPVTHACHYEDHCPPCAYLVNKLCNGGHCVRFNVPCHLTEVSCGDPCQKPLGCDHVCSRWCHKGPCLGEGEKCKAECIRLRECNHPCRKECHAGRLCSPGVCYEKIIVKCLCGRRKVKVLCFRSNAPDGSPVIAQCMKMLKLENIDTNQQDLQDYMYSASVKCTNDCRLEERNEKLAAALGISDAKLSSSTTPSYSEFLCHMKEINKAFVIEIEQQFDKLIEGLKTKNEALDSLNKLRHIYYEFKPMNRDKRRFIHELAQVYRIGTQSLDNEPNRNVQIKISPDSRVPPKLLSQLMQGKLCPTPASNPTVHQNSQVFLQSLSLRDHEHEIVFDSWEDIND